MQSGQELNPNPNPNPNQNRNQHHSREQALEEHEAMNLTWLGKPLGTDRRPMTNWRTDQNPQAVKVSECVYYMSINMQEQWRNQVQCSQQAGGECELM